MNSNELVSVIIPVFNAELYVREAIQSVFDQTYRPIEVICVNDGSKDGSLQVLQSLGEKITVIDSKENGGIGEARNKGVHAAKGVYLAFLDADDVWKPEKLAVQMNQLKQNPQLDIVFTKLQCFLSPELSEEVKQLRYCPASPLAGIVAGTSLMKKDFFLKVGYFNPLLRIGEFIDWFSLAKSMGAVFDMLPDVFLLRRIHATNTGVFNRPFRKDFVKIIKESLERKQNSK